MVVSFTLFPTQLKAYAVLAENMHPALDIHEVLLGIFILVPNKSNARNARVCKSWSPIALDCLWKYITDVSDILSSLAGPLEHNALGTWVRRLS